MIPILIALMLLAPGLLAVGFIWIGLLMMFEWLAKKLNKRS